MFADAIHIPHVYATMQHELEPLIHVCKHGKLTMYVQIRSMDASSTVSSALSLVAASGGLPHAPLALMVAHAEAGIEGLLAAEEQCAVPGGACV